MVMVRFSLLQACWTTVAAITTTMMIITTAGATAASVPVTTAQTPQTCDLQCIHPAAVCKLGEADYFPIDGQQQQQQQPVTNVDGTLFAVHQTTQESGMHCSCPRGWTGVTCDTAFSTCDYGSHGCFHGGKCIAGLLDSFGNDQLFCDCGPATDTVGHQYAGKFCEHQASTFCDGDGDGDSSHFCLNEGDCNPSYPSSGDPCFCSGSFIGDHCQFKTDTVADCDLDCDNGHCVLGHMTAAQLQDHYQFWDESAGADKNMYCQCNAGFDGIFCEIPVTECGDNHCFHGGTCIERTVNDQQLHHCDCATTDNVTGDSYAGLYCQYKANEYCTAHDSGFNGQLFCVNGGTCQPKAYDGCKCTDNFRGFACEFVVGELANKSPDNSSSGTLTTSDPDSGSTTVTDTSTGTSVTDFDYTSNGTEFGSSTEGRPVVDFDQDDEDEICTLDCEVGTCRNGKKELGFLAGVAETAAHLNQVYDNNFQHCVCPYGFVGLRCEHKVEMCDKGEHLCLHGALCTSGNGDDASCDCGTTDDDFAPVFVGEHCEHPATQVCTLGEPGPTKPLSFCVNFGTCLRLVTSDEAHPGCQCENGWDGPHCEIKITRDAVSNTNNNNGDDSMGTAGVFFMTILVLVVVVLSLVLATIFVRGRKRRKRGTNGDNTRWGSSNYQDNPEINLSPHHNSSFKMDPQSIYPPNAHSSSRDPMVTHLAPPLATSSSSSSSMASHLRQSSLPEDEPEIYIGPPRDEDGHELHNVEIV